MENLSSYLLYARCPRSFWSRPPAPHEQAIEIMPQEDSGQHDTQPPMRKASPCAQRFVSDVVEHVTARNQDG